MRRTHVLPDKRLATEEVTFDCHVVNCEFATSETCGDETSGSRNQSVLATSRAIRSKTAPGWTCSNEKLRVVAEGHPITAVSDLAWSRTVFEEGRALASRFRR